MSRWDDQFENHSVFQALASTRQQLESISAGIEDPAERESHSRLVRVCDYIDGVLKATDPELVPFPVLDQVAESLNQITAYLGQYEVIEATAAFLDSANEQADALFQQALALAPRVATADVQELQSAVSTFRRSAGQHMRNIEGEVEAVKTKAEIVEGLVTGQEAKIQAQDARLDSVVTDYQAQFSAAQEQRQTQFPQILEEGRAQFRETVTQAQATLKETTDEATTQLTELLTKAGEESEKTLTAAKERADTQHEELASAGDARVKELDELLAKAVKTVGAIGSTGMAGGYQIVANTEKKAADFWRGVAAFALLGAIVATIFAVRGGVADGFHVDTFFAKWAISVPFAALAVYAAHESTKHRKEVTANRKIELQLASLDTYLVYLPPAKQDEIRATLAARFFGELPASSAEGGASKSDA